jgi:hypothetical protein
VLISYFQPGLPACAIAEVQEVSVHDAKVKTRRGIQAEAAWQEVELVSCKF